MKFACYRIVDISFSLSCLVHLVNDTAQALGQSAQTYDIGDAYPMA